MDRLLEIIIFWLSIAAGLYTLGHGLILGEALESGDVYWATAEQLTWRLIMVMTISPCCFAIAIGFEIRNLYLDRRDQGRWRTKAATRSHRQPVSDRSATRKWSGVHVNVTWQRPTSSVSTATPKRSTP